MLDQSVAVTLSVTLDLAPSTASTVTYGSSLARVWLRNRLSLGARLRASASGFDSASEAP